MKPDDGGLEREGGEGASGPGDPQVVIAVSNEDQAGEIRRALEHRLVDTPGRLHIEVSALPARDVARSSRERFVGSPIGVIVNDEVGILEALTHGADEAMLWPERSSAALLGFFDRTLLRAELRMEHIRARMSLGHTEKLTALGTLVAGVAHEINNPLTALQLSVAACQAVVTPLFKLTDELETFAGRGGGASAAEIQALHEIARTGAPSHETHELLEEMLLSSKSIASVVRDLRIFARSEGGNEDAQVVDIADLVDQAVRLVGREVDAEGRLERDYEPGLPQLVAPPGRLMQVLVNLLVNAAQALREIKRPHHSVRITMRTDEEHVAISITDTGPGIRSEAVERIFDPFFTTKRAGVGTGLGLSLSRTIMRELGGDLIVESVHGEGATFIMLVPVPSAEEVRGAYFRTRGPVLQEKSLQRAHVLVVDDDDRVLRAYARVLGRSCNVLIANDGREAIELLRSGSIADAVVTELDLPDTNGQELFEWLSREQPRLAAKTIFVTAEATALRFDEFLAGLSNPVLTKPVTASQLLGTLDATVGRVRESGIPPGSVSPPRL